MKLFSSFSLLLFLMISCNPARQINGARDDGKIEINIIQINDVYEIAPLEGGTSGGMARVATLKKQLQSFNPNTYLVHSGDFLSPSLIGTLKYEDSRIHGKQMVEVMNATGVDLVTFGNHEFDIDEAELNQRLKESSFQWVSANVLNKTGDLIIPFKQGNLQEDIPSVYIREFKDADGTLAKIGFAAVTLDDNQVDYVVYGDYIEEGVKAYHKLAGEVDVVLGLTHLELKQDMELAKKIPGVPLIMGGHDHDHMIRKAANTLIAKADANAKTAFIHRLLIDTRNRHTLLNSSLVYLNESIPLDEETGLVVEKWSDIARKSFREAGFDPDEIISVLETPLDGREQSIRHRQTNMGQVITASMRAAFAGELDCAILNSGSIRIDDQLKGSITQYDIFRILPFGGAVLKIEMSGELLYEILGFSWDRKGNGAFLQWDQIERKDGQWLVQGEPLDKNRSYKIAINDFLLSGYDIPFFTRENKGIISITEPTSNGPYNLAMDIRRAVIAYIKGM